MGYSLFDRVYLGRWLLFTFVTIAAFATMALLAMLSVARADNHMIQANDVPELIDAIKAANEDGGTIVLAEGGTYDLPAPYPDSSNGLPLIENNVVILGNGATIQRSTDEETERFRIFQIAEVGVLHLQDVTLKNGSAPGDFDQSQGGGIDNFGELTLDRSAVIASGAVRGGGIHNAGGAEAHLVDSTVSGNGAAFDGGIRNFGVLLLENSTVSDNTSGSGTGGISNSGAGVLTLINSTVSGNSGDGAQGAGTGGIGNTATLTVINTTVANNHSGSNVAGGISNRLNGELTLIRSIVAGNTSEFAGPDILGTVIDGDFNLIGDGTGMTGISDGGENGTNQVGTGDDPIDPLLGLLQNNGGPTETMALLENSPAIDRIPEDECGVETDQRDVERPQGPKCDVGAFELEQAVDPVDPEPNDPAIRSDCMQGGWQEYGFRNQGLCIQFVNTDKDAR